MRPNTLRLLRRYHLYIGLFFAPMILLFSVSGALQTFRLQETKGYGGTPPNWIVWLAAVHKDQGPPREAKAGKSEGEKPKAQAGPVADDHDHDHDHADGPPAGGGAAAKRPNPLPLKIFVALLAVALALSTVMGIVIAVATRATRRVSVMLLVLGAIVPIVLLWV